VAGFIFMCCWIYDRNREYRTHLNAPPWQFFLFLFVVTSHRHLYFIFYISIRGEGGQKHDLCFFHFYHLLIHIYTCHMYTFSLFFSLFIRNMDMMDMDIAQVASSSCDL
jgi:hypothetical protein